MKNLKLTDLKLNSFVAEMSDVVGGALVATASETYTGATSCCNPTTKETTVDTCGNPAPAKCIKKM